jgi:hemin uptake protein HemP
MSNSSIVYPNDRDPGPVSLAPVVAGGDEIDASSLFCNRNEIVVRHKGVAYRLRLTRNDKLILTK